MTTFEESLDYAFFQARNALSLENQKTDKDYIKCAEKFDKLFGRIKKKLGKDKKLISDFEVLINEMGGIDEELIYLQGMIDCVVLLKKIRLI